MHMCNGEWISKFSVGVSSSDLKIYAINNRYAHNYWFLKNKTLALSIIKNSVVIGKLLISKEPKSY